MRILVVLAAGVLLSACASLSEDECLSGNWTEIGFRDGTQGRSSDHIARHAKACEDIGVVPVQSLWEKGRQSGLPVYCTASNAFSVGKRGNRLNPVCPASQMPLLSQANRDGMEFFDLTEEIYSLNREIDEITQKMVQENDASLRAELLHETNALRARIALLELQRGTLRKW